MSVDVICKEHCAISAPDQSWVLVDGVSLDFKEKGVGIDQLKASLADNEVAYVLITLHFEINKEAQQQTRNVILHWKPEGASAMKKGKSTEKHGAALSLLKPNEAELVVKGKKFTKEIILKTIDPKSGTHEIE
mmetsp:Transcript_45781/g.115247  ORF Transcript_45781/g.115247 Transcript_45781/m.115247 type:complete len:133 (+) Transcript_45781:77-475(+)|eukprot:CAMPEP_0177653858 /NCGR_PEP_ID=MMETSP0447-20121125/13975_1 /TAXON_ID=0 /ORGANISM="Stygamoeba regulata, Strain BSH-02190019" /LENGTH=132 /DNA_ID=CAMNT_0019157373 /DNA_START=51 /DNA_END=449 /DNA_ORIENTATION=-